jgi:hypothetical protein
MFVWLHAENEQSLRKQILLIFEFGQTKRFIRCNTHQMCSNKPMTKRRMTMKISKRLSALLLTLCMLLSLLPTTAFAVSTEDFSDFPPASHWAHEALEAAVQNGLMNGDGNRLNPADNLSRAEMAAVINRAFGATEKADISSFTDVAKGKWYYDDISKAVAMGTFQGDGGGIMRPEADITRQEAFLVLARAFELSGADASALDKFSDKADVASWASDALASMAAAGYINGSGGRLNPLANITPSICAGHV